MDSHTISALNLLEVWRRAGDGVGLRREARIVLESMSEPRLVAPTARRYGLSRSLLVTWRRALANRTKSEAGLVRIVVAEDGPVASATYSSRSVTAHSTERRIEIELTGGRRVIVDASVVVEALRRIIEALD
ncbi:IS66 family insertion sequence element accessory protein TnpB [Bradyrhizobium iriomotense]|nr:IS66 family insertion sequence element accessory protein TnpB [Bradyrhizobium iriomotense]